MAASKREVASSLHVFSLRGIIAFYEFLRATRIFGR